MRKTAGFIFLCLFMLVLTGCPQTYFTGFRTESNFAYPNSNIVPLGYAKGESGMNCGFMAPPFVDSTMQSNAVTDALRQKGGDILINYLEFQTTTSLMIIQCMNYSVEGTAAKMTIGTQNLK